MGDGQRQHVEGGRAVRRAVYCGAIEGSGRESSAVFQVDVKCKSRWACFEAPQLPPQRQQASTLARRGTGGSLLHEHLEAKKCGDQDHGEARGGVVWL